MDEYRKVVVSLSFHFHSTLPLESTFLHESAFNHHHQQHFFFIFFAARVFFSFPKKKSSIDTVVVIDSHRVIVCRPPSFSHRLGSHCTLVMKYPQLVSSRAVSEISDWLIKRLEDLDIEQPSVYSRLLLSLLHTPFKVNAIDLLEIAQLKVKFNLSLLLQLQPNDSHE